MLWGSLFDVFWSHLGGFWGQILERFFALAGVDLGDTGGDLSEGVQLLLIQLPP